MLSSKTKTGLSETISKKTSPATPRDSKLAKASAKSESNLSSPVQNPRLTVDRSSRSVDSKPALDSRSPKISTSAFGTVLSETIPKKTSPATPRDSKLAKASAKLESNLSSPMQNPRLSIDRSPRSVDLKPALDWRSPKISTPPNKQQRPLKGSELQAQLSLFQEDLKKARERLASVEKEKVQALAELKEAKRLADEANEKLNEALVAQKQAEGSSEMEKFRADELEQVGIETALKREEEWKKELEDVRNQHAVDVAALLSTMQELQRVKHELSMTFDAKNTALSHLDDAKKIAEINSEKVELLSGELSRLKTLLDSNLETQSNDSVELVKKLNSEVDLLKQDLERAKATEEKSAETESLIEVLRIEVINAKQAATNAGNMLDEWKKKVELLEIKVEEATLSERSASGSLLFKMKQLEESNTLLQDAESEITSLRENIDSLEISLRRHKGDLKDSERHLELSKQEAMVTVKTVESLKSEIQRTKEEKMQAMENETLAALNVQTLLEEKNKLINELEASRDEEEKSKKAMESLASALHEVSREVRDAEEKHSTNQAELGYAESQIVDLKLVLKATKENYESMLDEAKEEVAHLEKLVERSQLEAKNSKAELDEKELEFLIAIKKSEEEIVAVKGDMDTMAENSKAECDEKEFGFANAMKRSEGEIASIKRETDRLASLLKEAQEESWAAKEDGAQLLKTLKQVEFETSSAKEVAVKIKAENLRLKERLLDKENEFQLISQENNDLLTREASALKKADELAKLLEEALTKKTEENGKLSISEKEYNLLPKMVENEEEDADGEKSEKPKSELFTEQLEKHRGEDVLTDIVMVEPKIENWNGNYEEGSVKDKMWDSCKIVEKDLPPEMEPEPEPEPFEEKLDSKIDGDGFDQINGLSSETAEDGGNPPSTQQQQQQQQKKKKALLHKFGSLLKKKSNLK